MTRWGVYECTYVSELVDTITLCLSACPSPVLVHAGVHRRTSGQAQVCKRDRLPAVSVCEGWGVGMGCEGVGRGREGVRCGGGV